MHACMDILLWCGETWEVGVLMIHGSFGRLQIFDPSLIIGHCFVMGVEICLEMV